MDEALTPYQAANLFKDVRGELHRRSPTETCPFGQRLFAQQLQERLG